MSSLRDYDAKWRDICANARSLGWEYGQVWGGPSGTYHDWFKVVDGKRLVRGFPIDGDGLQLWRKEVETESGLAQFHNPPQAANPYTGRIKE